VTVVIKCVELAGSAIQLSGSIPTDCYLASYDPEYADGRGIVEWTRKLSSAMQFPDVVTAFRFYRQEPKARPVREDGRPNRPLTAFTIEVIPYEEA
jgi:hypothetical protein